MQDPYDYDLRNKIEMLSYLVAALRSGRYMQAHSKLREGTSFCCLGVACDLFAQHSGGGYWLEKRESYGEKRSHTFVILRDERVTERNPSVLPRRVAQAFGFDADDPQMPVNSREVSGAESLAALNDSGFTFPQIADLIEYFVLDRLKAYRRPQGGQRVLITNTPSRFEIQGLIGTVVPLHHLPDGTRETFADTPHAFIVKSAPRSEQGHDNYPEYTYLGFMDDFVLLDEANNLI